MREPRCMAWVCTTSCPVRIAAPLGSWWRGATSTAQHRHVYGVLLHKRGQLLALCWCGTWRQWWRETMCATLVDPAVGPGCR